jgi:hypothetical protein
MAKIAVLHEGALDKKVIENLIKYLKLDEKLVVFYPMGMKSNFFKNEHPAYVALSQSIEMDEINKVFFILDADQCDKNQGGLVKTQEKLQTMIQSLDWEEVSSFYITHNPKTEPQEGFIESLLLSTIPEDKMTCINQFLECSRFKKDGDKSTYERIYKALAHPFSPYNFEHQHFDELKTKLTQLFVE